MYRSKKQREEAIWGNYKKYYDDRHHNIEENGDMRVTVLERDWFQGRQCLDIGTNACPFHNNPVNPLFSRLQ